MRTQKLADKSPDRLADRGHLEVELTSLGRLEIVGFACPEIVGFDLSTEGLRARGVPETYASASCSLGSTRPGRTDAFDRLLKRPIRHARDAVAACSTRCRPRRACELLATLAQNLRPRSSRVRRHRGPRRALSSCRCRRRLRAP